MLEFEQAYGSGAPKDTSKNANTLAMAKPANDYPGSACNGTSSQFGGDVFMAQDTSTIGPMP